MGKIKRYSLNNWGQMSQYHTGTYVKFETHAKMMHQERQRLNVVSFQLEEAKAELAEVKQSLANAKEAERVLTDKCEYVAGCFNAAIVEGLKDVLAASTDAVLVDLVERRLMYAYYKLLGMEVPE